MTGGDMVKIKLDGGAVSIERYVVIDQDRHGNDRYYFRKKGMKKVRLRAEPGTETFLAEYNAARAGEHPDQLQPCPEGSKAAQGPRYTSVPPDSLRWLFDEYMRRSREWRSFGKTTQDRRRTVFTQICNEALSPTEPTTFGTQSFRDIKVRQMRVICDRCNTMATVNARVKAFRCAFKWAVKDDQLDANPARDLEYWREASDGFHTWTVDQVQQYRDRHPLGTMARLAIDLLMMTGQRRSDIVTFGRQHVRDGEITFTQIKGKKKKRHRLTLPILPALRTSIDATAAQCGTGGMAFLQTSFHKSFTANGFGNWFRKRCDEAGLPKVCAAHGLRKAGATIAAEAGATTHQLMAIFGWDTVKQAELYTRAAEQKKLARSGMAMVIPLESVPPISESVPPQAKP